MKNIVVLVLLVLSAHLSWAQPTKINHGKMAFQPYLKPFYHGVASGDPLTDRVILWTRVTPEKDTTVLVSYFVATDTAFAHMVKTGETKTDSTKDYTVKIDVEGLSAGQTYYYYFSALGANSMVGRTKTVPSVANDIKQLKFAVVSCNNYEGGFFNAYGRIAERHDLDAIIHLGDYIYEYAPGEYRSASLNNRVGQLAPAHEIINKGDYRLRYSLYRLDEDLMHAHQQHAFISVWDDHEFANDAYGTGAENHSEASEGTWAVRKAMAKQVYFEWMPIRETSQEKMYRKISYGHLMDLFMMDARMDGKDKPPVHFDDPDLPMRRMMSDEQLHWLVKGLKSSSAKWKVVGNQVILSTYNLGFAAGLSAVPQAPDATDIHKIRAVEDLFSDDWRGYPTQRAALIDSIKNAKINNVVFITGDSHCSWAFDVTKTPTQYPLKATSYMPIPSPSYNRLTGEGSVAVEFCTPGISSQNFDEHGGYNNAIFLQFLINNYFSLSQVGLAHSKIDTLAGNTGKVYYNPHLKHVDLIQQGYMMLDVKNDSTQADWYYVNVLDSSSNTQTTGQIGPFANTFKGAVALRDQNKVKMQTAVAPAKASTDIPAPRKKGILNNLDEEGQMASIFSLYPNPAQTYVLLNFGVAQASLVEVALVDAAGKLVKQVAKPAVMSGNLVQELDVSDLKAGMYFVKITTNKRPLLKKLLVR